jgi:plasmid stability protein
MSSMIQIRNVPVKVHRALKARAALAGKSMSELILEELQAMLALPFGTGAARTAGAGGALRHEEIVRRADPPRA